MCNNCAVNSQYWNAFEEIMSGYSGSAAELIPLLQQLQEAYGYLPRDIIERLAAQTKLSAAHIMGVITFYAQFRLEPVGKNIVKVCFGTACHVIGAENIADAICRELDVALGGTTADGEFTVESVACLGCCSLAPVVMINDETFGRLTVEGAREMVREFKARSNI